MGDRSEHDGLIAVEQHPVLAVPCHRPGQDLPLHVGASPLKVGGRLVVRDPYDVLLNDGAFVEVLGHVVGGGTDQLHTPVPGLLVR